MHRSVLPAFCSAAILVLVSAAHADVDRGDTLMAGGLFDDARTEYEKTLPSVEGDARWQITYKIGYCRLRVGQYKRAIQVFDGLLKEPALGDQLRAQAHLQAGYCHRILRQSDVALDHLNAAIESKANDETRIVAALYAGYELNQLKRWNDAIQMFQLGTRFTKAHPVNLCQCELSTGDVYRQLKQYDRARAAYQRALAIEGAGRRRVSAETKLLELDEITSGDAPFYIAPYVTKVSSSTAQLLWVTKGQVPTATVTLTGGGTSITAQPETSTIADDGFSRRLVQLDELQARTRYAYTIHSGNQTRRGSFKTAAVETGPVTFCVIGDTQTMAAVHGQVAVPLAAEEPDFVVHCGDLVENGINWFEWKSQLFQPGSDYFSKTVIWPTRGNHDGGPYYPQLFRLEDRQYYSFDYANVHVVVLDAFGPGAGGVARQRQVQWLARDLAATKALWKIVAVHDPMVNSDTRNAWWGEKDYLPIIERYGVDLVLSGHHHLYRRYLPIGQPSQKPVIHVTTGGAGGALGGNFPSPIMQHGTLAHHYLTFHVDGDRLEMIARSRDQAVLDRLTLTKSNGVYQPQIMRAGIDRAVARPLASLFYQLCPPNRMDLIVMSFERIPRPGQPVEFDLDLSQAPGGAVDVSAFPPDTQILVTAAESSTWQVAPQTIHIREGHLRFTATAPEKLIVSENRVSPVPEITLNVKLGERTFMPHRFKVSYRPETFRKAAAHSGGD